MRSHVLEWEFHGIPMNSNEVQVLSDSRASPRSTGRWSLGWQERFRASCNEAPSYTQQPSAAISRLSQGDVQVLRSLAAGECLPGMPPSTRRRCDERPGPGRQIGHLYQDPSGHGKRQGIQCPLVLAPTGDHCSGYHLRPSLLILMKRKQRQGFYTQIGRCCRKRMQKQKHRT